VDERVCDIAALDELVTQVGSRQTGCARDEYDSHDAS